jgi:hypothetical protein
LVDSYGKEIQISFGYRLYKLREEAMSQRVDVCSGGFSKKFEGSIQVVKVRPLHIGRPIPFKTGYCFSRDPGCGWGAVELHRGSYYMRMWLYSGHEAYYQQDFWHSVDMGGTTYLPLGLVLHFNSQAWKHDENDRGTSIEGTNLSLQYVYKTNQYFPAGEAHG